MRIDEATYDLEAEQAVLGSMMLSRDAAADVADILNGQDFYRPSHEVIFRTILSISAQRRQVDVLTVSDALLTAGDMALAGGPSYLHQLAEVVPSPLSGTYYADIVARSAIRRRLQSAGQKIVQLAVSPGEADELVEEAAREVSTAARGTSTSVEWFGDKVWSTLDVLDTPADHKSSPWPTLNKLINGFRPGGLYIIGARPSVGKSLAAIQIARHLTQFGSVAFNSLEMSEKDIHLRVIASDLQINLGRLLNNDLTPGDWGKISKRREKWQAMPLSINDKSNVTISEIRRFARSVNHNKPLVAVVVDYLQLMSQPAGDRRNRQEFIADMSRQLKLLAMEMGISVIALSQLNRQSEGRAGGEPLLSDLRESGAVEQDADVVILLHREIMGENRSDMKITVAKNRHGDTGVGNLNFWGYYASMEERGVYPSRPNLITPELVAVPDLPYKDN